MQVRSGELEGPGDFPLGEVAGSRTSVWSASCCSSLGCLRTRLGRLWTWMAATLFDLIGWSRLLRGRLKGCGSRVRRLGLRWRDGDRGWVVCRRFVNQTSYGQNSDKGNHRGRSTEHQPPPVASERREVACRTSADQIARLGFFGQVRCPSRYRSRNRFGNIWFERRRPGIFAPQRLNLT